ncbi:MAG: hypothetical protein HY290_32975, partial [Planctomycetia bacterium]|nr:hypothetical protein [Planctomycetia bacterium]
MLGNREFFRERMCIVGIAVSVLLTTLQTAQSTDRLPRDADLSTFPIEELDRRLDSAPRTHWDKDYDRCVPYGSILGEMIRRGGKSAELQLSRRLVDQDRQLENRRKQIAILPKDSDELSALERTASSLENNLELLTAIRRLKKQPDPLAVIVDRAGELKGGTRESPVFEVTLKNVDVQQRSFGFTHGGDYRSGRHERWRIHVWDSEGKLLPERPRWSGTAGGISNDCPLKFGETWECELPLESYVQIRTPG